MPRTLGRPRQAVYRCLKPLQSDSGRPSGIFWCTDCGYSVGSRRTAYKHVEAKHARGGQLEDSDIPEAEPSDTGPDLTTSWDEDGGDLGTGGSDGQHDTEPEGGCVHCSSSTGACALQCALQQKQHTVL